ncbi:MAG: GntP family permease [Cyclobacteriaceae bacterium]|nr:GntP family permease [Cyclobacteriaceae bacterium]
MGDSFFILGQVSAQQAGYKPVVVLLLAMAFILITIIKFRIHAFLALTGGAMLVAILAAATLPEVADNIKLVSLKFGQTAGGIGLVIALAAIIGMCLTDSGAAQRIVQWFMKVFGEKHAGWALLASGFLLSVPVFLDTVFFLLIPLARTLGVRTGKNYLLYVLALGGGAVITHSLVPPTPGPLIMVDVLKLDLGAMIIAGLLAGIGPAVVVLYYSRWKDKSSPLPVRDTEHLSNEQPEKYTDKVNEKLPPMWASLLPVLLPVLLIASFSMVDMLEKQEVREKVEQQWQTDMGANEGLPIAVQVKEALDNPTNYSFIHGAMRIFGDKIVALGIGAFFAVWLLFYRKKLSWADFGKRTTGPLELAGTIILITSAGGAFGALIAHSGIGELMSRAAENLDLSYILLAWLITAVIRVAQGSGTVSMITGAGLMAAVIGSLEAGGGGLNYHPVYIYLAVGFGSITCSWMNDSAFWIVGKLSGFTEKETLGSWTVMLTIISVAGLIQVLLLSVLLPMR